MFPVGCRWREVQTRGLHREAWAIGEYQFWDDSRSAWSNARPAACDVPAQQLTPG